MKTDEFTLLLGSLTKTCQELEEIKVEQTKDHERISKSFEKTLLSILRQEQNILNQVEEEHRRLKHQLSSIQKKNELALQKGVSEINSMVNEITVISSQIKQLLSTSNNSETGIKEIQERLSKIVAQKESLNINLMTVNFTPHEFLLTKLGEVNCEEKRLGFTNMDHKTEHQPVRDVGKSRYPDLLSDEKPPWENVSTSTNDIEHIGVRIMLNSGSESETSSTLPYQGEDETAFTKTVVVISPREQAVKNADKAALSPRTATKNWISDMKHTTLVKNKKASAIEGTKAPKSPATTHKSPTVMNTRISTSKTGSKYSTYTTKGGQRSSLENQYTTPTAASQHRQLTPVLSRPDGSCFNSNGVNKVSLLQPSNVKKYNNNITSRAYLTQKNRTEANYILPSHFTRNSHSTVIEEQTDNKATSCNSLPFGQFDNDTLFRATAAYVCEDDSDTSGDTTEDDKEGRGVLRDPIACRELAIKDSRVPSARKSSDGEQMTRWKPGDPIRQTGGNGDNTTMGDYLNIQDDDSGVCQSTNSNIFLPLAVDYMRMSDEKADKMSIKNMCCSPRSVSPAESVKSSYTFIIESPTSRETAVPSKKTRSFSKLVTKEKRKCYPMINVADKSTEMNVPHQASKSKPQTQVQPSRIVSNDPLKHHTLKNRKQPLQPTASSKPVSRSTSMPYIEKMSKQINSYSRTMRPASATERRDSTSSTSSNVIIPRRLVTSAPSGARRAFGKASQYRRKPISRANQQLSHRTKSLSKSESNLIDCPVDQDGGSNHFVKQFGKFGSGRAELNLPHGLYITTTGVLYIVDYGNKRLQVMDTRGKVLQQITLASKNYFDVAASNRGLVALTNSTDRTVEVYSKHGRLLQVISKNWGAPRGITVNNRDEFIVADMKLGVICALRLDSTTGRQIESTIVPGFNKPYLIDSNSQGLLAISERGFDGGCCVKVLREDWQLLRILGIKDSSGPALFNPWGVCIDSEGGVLVADWAHSHSIIYYPTKQPAQTLVTEGLSSPRGLALWQDCFLMVADSMHNCIKVFQYQDMSV